MIFKRQILAGLMLVLGLAAFVAAAGAPDGWANWRGPNNDGMARGDAPLQWSDKDRIAWKVAVPGRGHSSPVVWGDRIFLTTAVPTGNAAAGPQPEHRFVVLAYDRKTGKELWEKVARVATPHEGHHPQYGSFASNSPVVDSRHVIAFFGSRGVYCYTHDGQLVWEKDFGIQLRMLRSFGEGAWPALDGNTLVLLFDHEGDSFLVALEKNTGRELWRMPRPPGTSWAGPVITSVGGRKQVLVSATKFAAGYDLETGKLIWQATGLGRNTIPAPVGANGKLYMAAENGDVIVVRMGEKLEVLATNTLADQMFIATPAILDGEIYLRGQNTLF